MDRCADCRHNQDGYCDVYDQRVDSNKIACSEFEER